MSKIVTVVLTEGNIRHGHMYLRSVLDMFPDDVIGGSNKNQHAPKNLMLHIEGLAEPIDTDIAGDKMIFRKRGWCSEFFRLHRLQAGDQVMIERTGDYEFTIKPMRR